ncbi:cathelicidin antimicrobial peptide-like [Rhinophrynus dorsalis]
MDSCFQLVLVLEAISLLYSASTTHIQWSPLESKTIGKAIDLYNAGLNSSFVFRLFISESQHKGTDQSGENEVNFLIKETLCLKSEERNIENCDFKEDGEVQTCTLISPGSEKQNIEISCKASSSMSIPLRDNLIEVNENKIRLKHGRRFVRHSVKLSNRNKRAIGSELLKRSNTSDISSHASASCLWCIFDIFNSQPST